MERCVTCHYYDRQNGKSAEVKTAHTGQCRRTAPLLNPVNMKPYMIEGVWPTVRDDDWCGEWKSLVRRVDPARVAETHSPASVAARAAIAENRSRVSVLSAAPVQPPSRAAVNLVSALPIQPSAAAVPLAIGSGHAD